MIGRRAVLLSALAAPALGVGLTAAQPRSYRVGMLSLGLGSIEAFRRWGLPELASAGFVDGGNLRFFARWSEGDPAALPALASEIAAERPDVVIAVANVAAHVLRRADPSLSVVMSFAGTDPVADGLVASLARPNGLVTGIVLLAEELDLKRIELAREIAPGARLGFLAGASFIDARIARVADAARGLGVELATARAAGPDTHGPALEVLRHAGAGVVVVASFPSFAGNAAALASRAAEKGLPLVCEWAHMAEAGCLASYGPSNETLRRRTAQIVARVLRGEPPGSIPMEQPARFESVINLRAARRLRIDVPTAVLARADEVIE